MFKEIFGTLMLIFVVFNGIYYLMFPTDLTNVVTTSGLIILVGNVIITGGVLGITALSVGLDSESIRILVSGVGFSLLLFSIPIGINFNNTYYGFNLGLGLVSNIATKFGDTLLGYPFWIINFMGIIALISGIMVVVGND